jgi:hypothetical protein
MTVSVGPRTGALFVGNRQRQSVERTLALRDEQRVNKQQRRDSIRDHGSGALDHEPAIAVAHQHDPRRRLLPDERHDLLDVSREVRFGPTFVHSRAGADQGGRVGGMPGGAQKLRHRLPHPAATALPV